MKTASFAVAFALAFVAPASACSLTSTTQRRELQFVPQGKTQGPFRPSAPAQWQPNEFAPVNPQNEALPTAAEAQPADAALATNAEADPATSTPAVVEPSATTDTVAPSATTTTAEIGPGQPTITVIVPDFLAAGSGWSNYMGDVGETKAPSRETPVPDAEKPTSAAVSLRHGGLAATAVALSMAAATLGLSANA